MSLLMHLPAAGPAASASGGARRRGHIMIIVACLVATPALAGQWPLLSRQHPLLPGEAELRAAVANYEKGRSREQLCADATLAEARLQLEKLDILRHRYYPSPLLAQVQAEVLKKAAECVRRLGQPTPGVRTGFHERAYISDIDLSPQPYLVYVPTAYDGRKPFPLILFLHGYDGTIDKCNWLETMYSPDLERLAEELGFLVALPYGRSNTEFMGIGEADVLHVLQLMQQHYKVDESRVILSGASMGGSGAYTIACHYPHLFAGVFTITGRIDYYLWMGVPRMRLPRFKQAQIDMDYARDLLGNLLHIPVHIFHGRLDPLLSVEQSRLMARLLQERGQAVRYVEFANGDHYVWSDSFTHPSLKEWLKTCRRPEAPRRIFFRTYSIKYDRAYWLRLSRLHQWGQPAVLEASISDDGVLQLTTENAEAIIHMPAVLARPYRAPLKVVHNGKPWPETVGLAGSGTYVANTERILPREPPLGWKSPAVCGPVRDAFCSRFVLVWGTAGSEAETRTEHARAREAAEEWTQWTQGTTVPKPDTEVTEEELQQANLFLFGSPATNHLVRKIADRLPIRIEPEAYVVGAQRIPRVTAATTTEGGPVAHRTQTASLLMIYPNPLNPKRYVVISDGERWGRHLEINHRYDLVPDFIIFSQEIDRDGTRYETNRALCAGYFGSDWQLDPRSTWFASEIANTTMPP